MPQDCLFCKIIKGDIPSVKVYEDEQVYAFLDINPVNSGHALVIPRAHASGLDELDPGDGGAMFKAGMKIAAAIRASEIKCEGVNLFLADGTAAGQEVFHAHLHITPRYDGDGFGWKRPGVPDPDNLEEVAAAIRKGL